MQINSTTSSIIPLRPSAVAFPPQASIDTDTASKRDQESPPIEHSDSLKEPVGVSQAVTVDSGNETESASLKSESGSGAIPVKLATIVYALNHSFDEQKQMIDVLI